MRSAANTWFSALDEDERNDFKILREKFANKYAPAPISLWKRASDFWAQEQRQGQSVEDLLVLIVLQWVKYAEPVANWTTL